MDFSVAFADEIDEYVKQNSPTRYVTTYDPDGGCVTRICNMPPPDAPTIVAPHY